MDNNYIIDKIKVFCLKNNISIENVLSITIQQNRCSDFTSLTIDFKNNLILPNYPIEDLNNYKEIKLGDYLICYKDDLQIVEMNIGSLPNSSTNKEDAPFCCGNIFAYKPQKLDKEIYFNNFINKNGPIDNVVFEIKRQVDRGPIVSTKYFKLINNDYKQVEGSFKQKLHAFKNYKCTTHNLFFMVDLYSGNNSQVYNYHHMRLNPVTNINQDLLRSFFNLL